MNLISYLKRAEKLASDNSPALLTAVGVVGVVATAALSGRAALEADRLVQAEEELRYRMTPDVKDHELMTRKEQAKLVWKAYIPPVLTGCVTIGAIVCANQIGTRRTAAMAAAYTLSDKLHQEYKDKVVEKLGENKERALRDELAQERVDRKPPSQQIAIVGTGQVLCQEAFTGRYFHSTMETIKGAQNKVNFRCLHDGYASLSDFYEEIGLPATSESEEIGWTRDKNLELTFSTTLTPDKQPCIVFDFEVAPIRHYWKHSYDA